jgi:LysM repeat protein
MHRAANAVLATVVAVLAAACGTTTSSSSERAHDTTTAGRTATTAATVATTTTTTTVPQQIAYVVKSGDTLSAIAKQFHVPVSSIVTLNQLANPDRLTEGQTLQIPPEPPVTIVITPTSGVQGKEFGIALTGAKPAEKITFTVAYPGGTYSGRPHTAADDGAVTTVYATEPFDPVGTYSVTASGDMGSTATANFVVLPAPVPGSP